MSKETFFSKMPPPMKLVLLAGLVFMGLLLSGIITIIITAFYTKGDLSAAGSLTSDLTSPDNIFLLKIMQLINSTGMFIIPAMVFAYLVSRNVPSYLMINRKVNLKFIVLCFLIIAVVLPLLGLLSEWNEAIKLPSFLSGMEVWMRKTEEQAALITEAFLNINTLGALIFNLILIALIPALGEEFIFRGGIQKTMHEWVKNPHVTIIITSVIFSAVHLQFYGFIPRMFLGMILGYVFYWTGNLWYPIALHFINNAFTVSMYYLKNKGIFDMEKVENQISENILILIFSTLLLMFFLYVIRKQQKTPFAESQ